MLGVVPEQRRQSRVHLPVSAKVCRSSERSKADARIAYVRDANIRGAFFYCDLQVSVGDSLQVELSPAANAHHNVNCEANVVRVEESALNGLTGIAVEFYDFVIQGSEKSNDGQISKPFTGWSADMVEKKFARRPELKMYAARIQGAA
jgi:PilZ domain